MDVPVRGLHRNRIRHYLCPFMIPSMQQVMSFEPKAILLFEESRQEFDEIGNLMEELVTLARQINLEMDRDDVQEVLNPKIQELTIDEKCTSTTLKNSVFSLSSISRSNDAWQFDKRPQIY
ncbi:hypothetical protein TNCV_233301 [Trichonephila clavipes]|nr:hypothetical protein TNCV_233301 [Trichonephila clavipes]